MHRKHNNNANLALLQAAAAAHVQQHAGSPQQHFPLDEDAALLLQHHPNSPGCELKLPREFMDCFALAKGMHDGLSDYGLNPAACYDFPDPHLIRSFCSTVPIPYTAFDGIRRSKHKVELSSAQEEIVLRAFDKLVPPEDATTAGSSSKLPQEISASLPFVSAFFDQLCPALGSGEFTQSRRGATYLLLSVITGNTTLCSRCLKAGANPNNMTFLRDEDPPAGEMFHGYSPVFMAVLAEQIEVIELLCRFGGSVHVYDRWGRTPLHAAVATNSTEVVQWLLAKGASRYVGDCLNLMPAEGTDESTFPELVMPNPALHGKPPKPPRSYFQQMETLLEMSDLNASKVDDAAGNADHATNGSADIVSCHCHSGRAQGYCGCYDDMCVRWSVDRLTSSWSRGVDYFALSQRSVERQQSPVTVVRRKR